MNDEQSKEHADLTVAAEQAQSELQGFDESTERDNVEQQTAALLKGVEISLCRHLLHAGMGSAAAREAFEANRVSEEVFRNSAKSMINNPNLAVRIQGNYLQWDKAAPIVLGMAAYNMELPVDSTDVIPVEQDKNLKQERMIVGCLQLLVDDGGFGQCHLEELRQSNTLPVIYQMKRCLLILNQSHRTSLQNKQHHHKEERNLLASNL